MKFRNLLYVALAAALGGLLAAPVQATQGVTDSEIVLGSHLPLSGPVALWGVPAGNGMRMRADEVNAAGGINGRKIRLIVEDNGYQQNKAAQAGDKLLDHDKVFALVGVLGTPPNMVTMPKAVEMGVPNLFPITAAKEMYEPLNKYKFGAFVPYYDQARAIVSHFAKTKGYKKIGVMYQDDDFGENVLKGAQDQVKAMNLEMVAETSYKRGAKEFGSQIAQLKAAGAQLVVLGTIISESIGAKVEARKLGWTVDMAVTTAGYTPEVAALAKGAADGLYGTSQGEIPYEDSVTGPLKKWVEDYKAKFGIAPSVQATAGYLAMDLFVDGARNAGKNLTADSLSQGIEAIHNKKTIFADFPVNFSATNHLGASHKDAILLCVVKGTRWVRVEPITY
jgi:ABC-type branched-subunit amino acid transport system substrate-binding protein